MKKIIAAVMAGIIALIMTGCAVLRPVMEPVKQDKNAYAKALIVLGDASYKSGDYKKALGHYDEALRDLDNYVVYAKIAICLKKLGNTADAVMVYRKAMRMKLLVVKNKKERRN